MDLVGNSEDRFSHDAAHFTSKFMFQQVVYEEENEDQEEEDQENQPPGKPCCENWGWLFKTNVVSKHFVKIFNTNITNVLLFFVGKI